jgi:hypothetical protein
MSLGALLVLAMKAERRIVSTNKKEVPHASGHRGSSVDKNIARKDLADGEKAYFIAIRKDAYERLHPETKHGAVGNGRSKEKSAQIALSTSDEPAERFSKVEAANTGRNEATVARAAVRDVPTLPAACAAAGRPWARSRVVSLFRATARTEKTA